MNDLYRTMNTNKMYLAKVNGKWLKVYFNKKYKQWENVNSDLYTPFIYGIDIKEIKSEDDYPEHFI